MSRQTLVALASGMLFGAGLAISGMTDPARVSAFLDVGGSWDPTLAFVMGGALLPMAVAWALVRRRGRPLVADAFHLPSTTPIDARLLGGAALFGIGWGVAGLCPGPAVAALAVAPVPALVFCVGMTTGFVLFRLLPAPPSKGSSMEFTHLADNFAVSPQLDVADVERARRAGFRSIIANRLDGEDARQPSAAQIAAEATRLGLAFAHIPIGFTQAGDADADAMARAMRELPKPILAYCRTGTRSAALWALGLAPDSEPGELVRRAAAAGHKITALMPSLRRRAGGR